jgi:hypothetical protein
LNNYFEIGPIIEKMNKLDKNRLKNYKSKVKANTTRNIESKVINLKKPTKSKISNIVT